MEKYYVFMSSFFDGAIRPPTGQPSRTKCFRSAAKSCKDKTKLFFILFKGCHWSFVLLDLTKHCIQLYDSLSRLVTSLARHIRCVLCLLFSLPRDYDVDGRTFYLVPDACSWSDKNSLSPAMTWQKSLYDAKTSKHVEVNCWWLEPIMAFGNYKVGSTETRWAVETNTTYFQVGLLFDIAILAYFMLL
jgi:hypothetical protein